MDHLSNRTLVVLAVVALFTVGVSWLIDNDQLSLTTFMAVFTAVAGVLGLGAAGVVKLGQGPAPREEPRIGGGGSLEDR